MSGKLSAPIGTYNSMVSNVRRLEGTLLELMRHPDTTPAHLAQAHATYVAVWASLTEVRSSLRKRFPDRKFIAYPWNKD